MQAEDVGVEPPETNDNTEQEMVDSMKVWTWAFAFFTFVHTALAWFPELHSRMK